MRRLIVTACLLAFGLTQVQAQARSDAIGTEVDQILAAYFKEGKFNGSVLLARDGDIVYEKNWGYADLETKTQIHPEAQYYIASITKIFTSTAVLLLEQKGLLCIDDPISKYLPELPACFNAVSIRHLLTHTGGVPQESDDWQSLVNTDNSDVMRFLDRVEHLDFEPGTRYTYSNNGYVLLAQLIEEVSGQSFQEYLEESVFKPTNMNQSFVIARGISKTDLHVPKSYVHGKQADWPLYRVGPAGIYTTVRDLYRFDQAYFTNSYFSPKEMERILTPVRVNGTQQHYGLGWGILDMGGERYLGHFGGTFGFQTLYEHQLKANVTLILFSNIGDSTPIMEIRNKLNQVLNGK